MRPPKPREFVVILHNIRSLHNVGSIFRTADASGVSKIYLCGITPAPVDRFGRPEPKLTKVSLGAEKYIPWEKMRSAAKIIDTLKMDGYKIFAIEQNRKSIPYYKIRGVRMHSPARLNDISRSVGRIRIALLLGNEVRGLPPSILKKCDRILEIPMRGAMVRQAHHPKKIKLGKESLNVSVAFGIIAFEFARQLYKI